MNKENVHTDELLAQIEELKISLDEANAMIDAIRDGSVDALVLTKDGRPQVYSLETADYTYRVLIEKFEEGAVSIADSGMILYCNDYFGRLLGMRTEQIIGSYFHSFIDSVGQFQELRKSVADGPVKGQIVLNVGGRKIPVQVAMTDLRPLVPALAIIVTDLRNKLRDEAAVNSIQKTLEEKVNELQYRNAQLLQFVHVVAHEIKEPVRKIVAYCDRINSMDSQAGRAAVRKNLQVICSSATRLSSLVDDLVSYSQNTTKGVKTEVDVNALLCDVIEDLDILIQENDAQIIIEDLPVLMASEFQLRQLFMNLISNSIKYRKKDVPVRIEVSCGISDCIDLQNPNRKFHRISVSDNGMGISAGLLGRIFSVFHRTNSGQTIEGSGIGLAICKRIMENHGGTIEVESAPNDGSTFHVYFPLG